MSERWQDWTSHGYGVGVAWEDAPDPYCAFLLTMPGVAMQGKTISECLEKLDAAVPSVLAILGREGLVSVPDGPHGFACESFSFSGSSGDTTPQ